MDLLKPKKLEVKFLNGGGKQGSENKLESHRRILVHQGRAQGREEKDFGRILEAHGRKIVDQGSTKER